MTRVRTVEYDPGFGWIARNPATGEEIMPNFRWSSRAVARTVVMETVLLTKSATQEANGGDHG